LLDGIGVGSGPGLGGQPLDPPLATTQAEDIRARARLVDPSDHRARVRFCRTLKDEYTRGQTHKLLAEVWGLSPSTVNRDLSIAWAEIQEANDGIDAAIWYQDMRDLLALTMADREIIDGGSEQYVDKTTGKLAVEPMDLNFVAQAKSKPVEQAMKLLETMGRALGVVAGPNKTDVTVNVAVAGANTEVSSTLAFAMARALFEAPSSPQRTTEKAKEPGRIMFAVGLLVLTWLLAGHTVALR